MSTKAMTISAAVLVFLLALGLTLYPLISNQYNQQHQSQIHTAYRLLVRGSRIPYEEAEETVSSVSSEEGAASTWEEKYINGILTGLCIVGIISIIALTVWYIRRR